MAPRVLADAQVAPLLYVRRRGQDRRARVGARVTRGRRRGDVEGAPAVFIVAALQPGGGAVATRDVAVAHVRDREVNRLAGNAVGESADDLALVRAGHEHGPAPPAEIPRVGIGHHEAVVAGFDAPLVNLSFERRQTPADHCRECLTGDVRGEGCGVHRGGVYTSRRDRRVVEDDVFHHPVHKTRRQSVTLPIHALK